VVVRQPNETTNFAFLKQTYQLWKSENTLKVSKRILLALFVLASLSAGIALQSEGAEVSGRAKRHPAQWKFWREQQYMTGNWAGLRDERDKLVDSGITATAAYVTDILGNPVGGIDQAIAYAGSLDVDIAFDLEKLGNLKGLEFEVSASWASGRDLSAEDIGNIIPVSQTFNGDSVRLAGLSLEQSLFAGDLSIRAGRIATGDEFLTSPPFYHFVSSAINGNPQSVSINVPSFTSFPVMTWGIRVRAEPVERFYVMGGAYNSDPSLGRDSAHGVDFSFSGDVFAIGEIGYILNQEKGSSGLPGNYKIGGYYDSEDFTDLSNPLRKHAGNYGLYVLVDQMVYREGGPESHQGLTPFVAFTFAPSDRNTLPFYFYTGLVYHGLFPGRDSDVTAFGLAYGKFSDDLSGQDFEMVLEWTHEIAIAPWLSVQPDVQYIIKPSGTSSIPDALVLGAEIAINF
jgi:porin